MRYFSFIQKVNRRVIQIDQGLKIQLTQFFECCLKNFQQSYSRLALLALVRSLECGKT